MVTFRTEIFPDKSLHSIDYSSKILFLGSCFSANIGNKLSELKFPVLLNPFGVLYNPYSIKNTLEIIMKHKCYTELDISFANNKWFSFQHHTTFSGTDKTEVLKKINEKISESNVFLNKAKFLFVTFGTAWYYRLLKNNKIVANCHKLPASEFERNHLSPEEIVKIWEKLMKQLQQFNPKLKIIFTVSPIRHLKDGAIENQLSKSILFVALHQLLKKLKNATYFPSYELLMDDLRDYRFYADDMIHLNDQAISYIWEKFKVSFIDQHNLQIGKQIEQIITAAKHKVFHPQTESYRDFLKNQLKKIKNLNEKYPFIDFKNEQKHFETELVQYFGNILS